MRQELVEAIQKLVAEIREENHIVNEIIRDDVFSILQACECNVLYYPLEGEENDGCDGCHIEKYVGGEPEQFVFINTNNTRERQAFSAAHELGHIWKVDERLRLALPDEIFDVEEVINRFAAELLMPEKYFREEVRNFLRDVGYQGPRIDKEMLLDLTAYLMNQFFVPFKAVILRYVEIHRLSEKDVDIVLNYKNSIYMKQAILARQYTRLGIVNRLRSMERLQAYLVKAEEMGVISDYKAKAIRKEFEIESPMEEKIDIPPEKIEF